MKINRYKLFKIIMNNAFCHENGPGYLKHINFNKWHIRICYLDVN